MYRHALCKVGMNIDPKHGLGMSSGKQMVRMDLKDVFVCNSLGGDKGGHNAAQW